MSEFSYNTATIDQTDNSPLQTNNVYIYKGGKIDEADKHNIKHVRIDESVTALDDEAFNGCANLQSVAFSTSHNVLKEIGNKSFNGCRNLLSINLQDCPKLEAIGEYGFGCCDGLATIQFPSTIRQIGKGCFVDCDRLNALELSHAHNLKTIEDDAFSFCSAFTAINLPPTISCIEKRSFYDCEALETVDLRLTCVERIGDYAFDICANLKTIKFPKTLKSIGNGSFGNCERLEYMNLGETSVERIGNDTFFNCTNLSTIVGIVTIDGEIVRHDDYDGDGSMNLPASLVDIGKDCFFKCPKLTNKIDNNWIHYQCDINRGGRQFLQRNHHDDNNSNHDGSNKHRGKVYYSSLWPLILHLILNKIGLPEHVICPNDDNLLLYTKADSLQRRASVIYYLLVHGVVADLQPSS